jgi:hypothetical protein
MSYGTNYADMCRQVGLDSNPDQQHAAGHIEAAALARY